MSEVISLGELKCQVLNGVVIESFEGSNIKRLQTKDATFVKLSQSRTFKCCAILNRSECCYSQILTVLMDDVKFWHVKNCCSLVQRNYKTFGHSHQFDGVERNC